MAKVKDWRVEQKKALSKRLEEAKKTQPRIADLNNKLLSIGGKLLVPPMSDTELQEIDRILDEGRPFKPRGTILMKGEPSRCHDNVLYLWDANRKRVEACTGYALSSDGLWRSHSWGLTKDRGKVVETTEKRKAYFGFCYSPKEAEQQLGDIF